MKKTNNLKLKKRLWLSFFAALLMVGVYIGIVLSGSAADTINISYSAGKYLPHGADYSDAEDWELTGLFSDFTKNGIKKTIAGTLILPGPNFADNLDGQTLTRTDSAALDSETFYFKDTDDWAYTFTGWKIASASEKIPGKTVFQPGDVVLPEILTQYASDGSLELEAVWGKCYFIQNPYENMQYGIIDGLYQIVTDTNKNHVTKQYGSNGKLIYSTDPKDNLPDTAAPIASSVPTDAADVNTGNDPEAPKATIDSLYEYMRLELGTTLTEQRANTFVYDAYSRVVMLLGELDYYTDNKISGNKYYGYTTAPSGGDKVVPISATYKSLGDTEFKYNYKPKNYSNTIYGNLRFDNVNFLAKRYKWDVKPDGTGGQDYGVEFQISNHNSIMPANSYIEFTARYNASKPSDRSAAISTLRPNDLTYVVVNGGTFNGMQNQYSSPVTTGKQLYWTVGRKANISNLNCGTTTSYSTQYQNVYYNYNVYLLGGKITNVYGGNNGLNTISVGVRNFFLYGDGTDGTDNEYDIIITDFYGGASESRLFGDIYIKGIGCTKLKNMYGGGKDYSATTYGNINIELEDCVLSGNVYGGGKYGNCELTPDEYIQYANDPDSVEKVEKGTPKDIEELDTALGNNVLIDGKNLSARKNKIGGDVTVKLKDTEVMGNVFGSGMGQTQVLEVRNQMQMDAPEWWNNGLVGGDNQKIDDASENVIPTDDPTWRDPIQGYPSYSISGDNRVFVNAWREGTYTTSAADTVSYYNYHAYASLSLATVQNVTITISDHSVIGREGDDLNGNVYGGGSIAKVLGDTTITITDSTVYGDVYGGGDGVTIPSTVKVYWPDDDARYQSGGALYDSKLPEYASPYYTGTHSSISWVKQTPNPDNRKNNNIQNAGIYKKYIEYSWSNDSSLLDSSNATYGIDHTNKLLYSPNTEGLGSVEGNTNVTINGDSVMYGNVYGGGNQGMVFGDTHVTIEGNAKIGDWTTKSVEVSEGVFEDKLVCESADGTSQVFGGGNGDASKNQTDLLGAVYGDTYLTIAGNCLVHEAYGGCNAADVLERTENDKALTKENGEKVYITAGSNTNLTIQGGTVYAGFGGNNIKGNIDGEINTTLKNDGKITHQLFGGGNLADYAGVTQFNISGGKVGSLDLSVEQAIAYGGGKNARVNGTNVVITGGEIRTLFGGSLAADINGDVNVEITGGTIYTFLGGNDVDNLINGDINITVGNAGDAANDNLSITNFFGGGNAADYKYGEGWSPSVTFEDYEHDDAPDPTYKGITVTINSGTIYQAFGGGVEANVTNARVYSNGGAFNFLYGGGYRGNAAYTVIHMKGGTVSGNMLPEGLEGDPPFENQYGGYVFGGGYQGYVMSASIHLEDDEGGQPLNIGHSLFGGGNKAAVGFTHVVIKSGTVIGSVYGGGFEGNAGVVDPVTGLFSENYETRVVISGGNIGSGVTINGNKYIGNIYGGGYMGETYKTHVDIAEINHLGQEAILTLYGNVYGGGHNAAVTTNTYIHFLTGTIKQNIYGGGRNGDVKGISHVDFVSGVLEGSVYAGGYMGKVNDTKLLITDDIDVVQTNVPDLYNSISKVTELTGDNLYINIKGDIFGGGEGPTATVLNSTNVVVDMLCDFTCVESEPTTTKEITSGEIKTTISSVSQYSVIEGNVYGGGDLGKVGEGVINNGNNTAVVSLVGSTSVMVKGGHIKSSVFGGGNGIPDTGAYEQSMGAVFGSTTVNITGGYIEKNIYGGGTQSRVYSVSSNAETLASLVKIEEQKADAASGTPGSKIAIGGSVFGGGDRGGGGDINASTPTTIGNVEVYIKGVHNNDRPGDTSNIYFLRSDDNKGGGVYGDGNLCLVRGNRKITLENFNTGDKYLKTFYSLQRSDEVYLINSDIVLLGAVDLVDETDTTVYSINRVSELYMSHGSTFKLDSIVKLLGHLESDVDTSRGFIDKGNNGINHYEALSGVTPNMLTEAEMTAYHAGSYTDINGNVISDADKNVVCVANGLYLEIFEATNVYGAVKGLFTLELLYANPGEGGGFVYANILTSTGDFICETEKGVIYVADTTITTETAFNEKLNGGTELYERIIGEGYVIASTYKANTVYYTKQKTEAFMDVVDDVGGYIDTTPPSYTYYLWYISGPLVSYNTKVTGYIGHENTSFTTNQTIPDHNETLLYTLFGINGNDILKNALTASSTYQLVQTSAGLTGQQIALEIVHKSGSSLGFLIYDAANDVWGIVRAGEYTGTAEGYAGKTALIDANTLAELMITNDNNQFSIVLHKSKEVNTELTGMQITIELDLLTKTDKVLYAGGTSNLIFNINVAIVRLVPEQEIYTDSHKMSQGVQITHSISITKKSSFTANYITRYIPDAFPYDTIGDMQWILSTNEYKYYMDEAGHFMTMNSANSVINKSEQLIYRGTDKNSVTAIDNEIYYDGEKYWCRYSENGVSKDSEMELKVSSAQSIFPKYTKITMVDLTESNNPTYYYYIVMDAMHEINLMDFCVMGTATTIGSLTGNDRPTFLKEYYQENATFRVSENLVFMIDFINTDWSSASSYQTQFLNGTAFTLKHLYKGKEIMDYVKLDDSTGVYQRFAPTNSEYSVDITKSGIDESSWSASFGVSATPSYYGKDTAKLNLKFNEDIAWENTLFDEGAFSLKIELLDPNGNPIEFPVGISFRFNGEEYNTGIGRNYAVVPLKVIGNHSIDIESLLFDIYSNYSGERPDMVTFRLTVYTAPVAEYFNTHEDVIIRNVSFYLFDNPYYSVSVNVRDGQEQVFSAGDVLKLKITGRREGIALIDREQNVTVTLEMKNGSGYSACDWVFEGTALDTLDIGDTNSQNTYQGSLNKDLKIASGATKGTYRLKVTYLDRVDYLYFIIS